MDGLAELKIPSKKTYYKISYVGFVPATGKIEATETEKTVYLEEDHLGLNEVVSHRFAYSATHQDVARYDASLGRQAVGRSRIQQPATGIAAGNSRSEYPEGGPETKSPCRGSTPATCCS